jgi:aldoxime dehydratase
VQEHAYWGGMRDRIPLSQTDAMAPHGEPRAIRDGARIRVVDANGRLTEKSYGQSWWKSLATLERWAESHPTHVRIFGAAMKYLSTLGPSARLRLYHEVTVAAANEQFFEYLGCHPQTGMLTVVDAAAVEPT